ncbi:hypothetical protein Phi40:1_gp056 [Cellulophaga phage phi40:1]|mgnify:CR=1 FL=1|uniref:Uncharacterized protein n=1 Tax=Cellulophaga phage phi38:1 TaxID=1327977 RepID=R9ZY96_9CAUD|nr:hypothetical protein Phi38:1_gp056 [Cellulophaga phage phi38:1]AGO47921.1 hypothetical protein Phi40:1_gp056 [Cellulophaga phage phi40:1]AGO48086.1 hypothetical protein Phi38:1_gp056 [Cellulophaga phage phi38:1]
MANVSSYQKNVNDVNKALKAEGKTLGGCVKMLLIFKKEINLSEPAIELLTFIRDDSDAFKKFKKTVRTSKYKGKDLGTYSAYYVLQTLHRTLKVAKDMTTEPVEAKKEVAKPTTEVRTPEQIKAAKDRAKKAAETRAANKAKKEAAKKAEAKKEVLEPVMA